MLVGTWRESSFWRSSHCYLYYVRTSVGTKFWNESQILIKSESILTHEAELRLASARYYDLVDAHRKNASDGRTADGAGLESTLRTPREGPWRGRSRARALAACDFGRTRLAPAFNIPTPCSIDAADAPRPLDANGASQLTPILIDAGGARAP